MLDPTSCRPGPTGPPRSSNRAGTRPGSTSRRCPPDQEASDVSGETDSAGWMSPSAALAASAAGALALMPPTQSILMEMAELGSVAAVVAAAADRTSCRSCLSPSATPTAGDSAIRRSTSRREPNCRRAWGTVPARSQPRTDDPRRHQHLDRRNSGFGDRPSSSIPVPPTPAISTPFWQRPVVGSPSSSSPTATPITRRARLHWRSCAGCAVRAVDPAFRIGAAGRSTADRRVRRRGGRGAAARSRGDPWSHRRLGVAAAHRPESPRLLTGDTVLGRGTTVIAAPDGDLAAYLARWSELLALVDDRGVMEILPGHGPVVDRPREMLRDYLAHRQRAPRPGPVGPARGRA